MRKVLLFVCLLMAGMTVNVNAAKQKAKHVILIGMDGWGAYSVPKADIPAIKSLMTNGCYTLHSRSVLPSSSAINWASILWEWEQSYMDTPPGARKLRRSLHVRSTNGGSLLPFFLSCANSVLKPKSVVCMNGPESNTW